MSKERDNVIELTAESWKLVEKLVAGPGRHIPKLAALLARKK